MTLTLQSVLHLNLIVFQCSVSLEFLSDDVRGHQLSNRLTIILRPRQPALAGEDGGL